MGIEHRLEHTCPPGIGAPSAGLGQLPKRKSANNAAIRTTILIAVWHGCSPSGRATL